MIKSILSIMISLALIFAGAVYENKFVNKQFSEFNCVINSLYEKTATNSANKEDVLAAVISWRDKKHVLHIFIPHTNINEIELWLSETLTLIEKEKYDDAKSKLDVLRELIYQIPQNFSFDISNIL